MVYNHLLSASGRRPCLLATETGPKLVYQRRDQEGHTVVCQTMTGDPPVPLSAANIDTADLCAVVSGGRAMAIYNQLVDGRYVLFVSAGGEAHRIAAATSSIVHPAAAVDASGRVHLAYQRDTGSGAFGIYYQVLVSDRWSAPSLISELPGNHWCPAVTVTTDGRVAVAWDGYAAGAYDIYLCFVASNGAHGPIRRLTDGTSFHAHVSLAPASEGDLWVAWNRGTSSWGKDNHPYRRGRIFEYNYLHGRRSLEVRRVRCEEAVPVFPDLQLDFLDLIMPGQHCERPRAFGSADGRLYVAFRYNEGEPRAGARSERRWQAMVTSYDGDDWTHPVEIVEANGLSTGGVSLLEVPGRLLVAAAGEGCPEQPKALTTSVHVGSAAIAESEGSWQQPPLVDHLYTVNTRQSMPGVPSHSARYRTERDGETLTLFFGDVHRHTEFSFCRACIDGSLEEAYRYARDAACMDFVMTADHDHQEATPDMWLEVMQAADRYYVPGLFTTFFGYEWIGGRDNRRHRNVVSAERIPPPSFEYVIQEGGSQHRDVRSLWESLPRGRALTIPHHTACGMSLLWGVDPGEAVDCAYEPLVEIFQASRGSSEDIGAPTLLNHFSRSGEYRREFNVKGGTVKTALQQGLQFGFIASSDHMSTHQSYACLYARENTRQELLDAMAARHTYAATDRIVCEFRLGDALMGDVLPHVSGNLPLFIRLRGTHIIGEIALLRDCEPYRVWYPESASCEIREQISAEEAFDHYFYVRMQQVDTNLCWSSPIWVDSQRRAWRR